MKWAIVTGASAGFGQRIAERLAENKFNLLLMARRQDRLEAVAHELRQKHFIHAKPIVCDIQKAENIKHALAEHQEEVAACEVLVNNAGLAVGLDPITSGNPEDWDTMIDTNVKGLLYLTREVVPHMVKAKRGHIVNIGSVAGRWVYPAGGVYCATKFAVRALSEGLRMDLLGTGVRVTNIEPGMAETEFSEVRLGDKEKAKQVYAGMTPLSAEDIAEAVAWSISRPAHVNISEMVIFPTDQSGVGPGHVYRKPTS